jgi:hypothetical protein
MSASSGFTPDSSLAHISAAQSPIDAEMERLASIARRPNNIYIYSPVIMNTVLTMMVLNNVHGNLLLPVSVPYGGYQLTYNGTDHIEESVSDIAVNKKVNAEIIEYIKKGDARFAVSLFLHDDVNPANNHANMLLFEYKAKTKTKKAKITVFHYEPYGTTWARMFPDIVDIQERLLTKIINDIKKIQINFNPEVKVHHQLKTIINQADINAFQVITEGGYCQMIALLQAYLFLNYGDKSIFTPNGQTPLGSIIGQRSPSVANGSSPLAEFQLNVIRGFVIEIGEKINKIFRPIGIDVSIETLSHIQHLYDQQPGAPPIYLIYIDALVKYVGEQIRTDHIIPFDIETDIIAITAESHTVVDASTLRDLENKAMRLLTRLPNGEFDLLAREKQRILSAATVRDAAAAKKTKTRGGKSKTKKTKKKQRKTKKRRERQRK